MSHTEVRRTSKRKKERERGGGRPNVVEDERRTLEMCERENEGKRDDGVTETGKTMRKSIE